MNDLSYHERMDYIDGPIEKAGRRAFLERLAEYGIVSIADRHELQGAAAQEVEFLSHGWIHGPQNGTMSPAQLRQEIIASRRTIGEQFLDKPTGFALPHGCRHP